MQVNWRGLFGELNIEWRDRGSNHARGNVNIKCPWCFDDPSFHLGVSESIEAYYCYREPDRHSGRSFQSLLIRLGQPRAESIRLLNQYRAREATEQPVQPRTLVLPAQIVKSWDRFVHAATNKRALDYLRSRGFAAPAALCETYGLRVATEGVWANRILFPMERDGVVVTWLGRAFVNGLAPKYMMQVASDGNFIYIPDLKKTKPTTLVIVEGVMDALRLSVACRRLPYVFAGLNGKHLGHNKLSYLRKHFLGIPRILVCYDADVALSTAYKAINEFEQALRPQAIGRAKLPPGYKDPGELPTEEIIPWLDACISSLR